jgi:hypothetical protein
MKTILKTFVKTALLITIYCLQIQAFAQAPQKMSYQAVLRDNNNALIANTTVRVKISIIDALQPFVPVAYAESHTTTTNANGLVTLEIGGGTVISGIFSNINWGGGSFSVKTETDPTGGTNYTIVGTSQLLSVPYALYSATSSGDNKWTSNPNGINNTTGNVGIGTTTPTSKLNVNGQVTIDQKNFGGYGGLLIKGGTSNYPNIAFSTNNSEEDVITGLIGGVITENGFNYETMDLTFQNKGIDGYLTEKMRITSDGYVGIGISTPNAPLQFANTIANRKVVLWENASNNNQYYGFGINGGTLRYQVADEVADHAFFAGTSSTTSKELLRIKGNGAIAVNGNMGEAGQVLTSAGAGAPATWSNIPKQYSKSYYDPGYQWKGLPVNVSTPTTLTSLSQTITTSADISRALISYNLLYAKQGCSVPFGCNPTATIYLYVNGSIVNAKKINLTSDALDYSEITLSNFAYNLIAGTNTIEIKVQKDNVLVNNFLVYQQSVSAVVYPE